MPHQSNPHTSEEFVSLLKLLHDDRRKRVHKQKQDRSLRRKGLTAAERTTILQKTGRRCHICGGEIEGPDWDADHVLAHSSGGAHSVDNYLPAHGLCNNYRWNYLSEELQWILKLGVWLRTQIEIETKIGDTVATAFIEYERRRIARRRPKRRVKRSEARQPRT